MSKIDVTDPTAFAMWLARLQAHVNDLAAVAEDQTRAPGARDIGRRAARSIVLETTIELGRDIAAAAPDEPAPSSGRRRVTR